MLAHAIPRLVDRLPDVRGELSENAPLAGITWFRTGGPAEILFRPADADDLRAFLAGIERDICLLYTSPSPRDQRGSRMPSSA